MSALVTAVCYHFLSVDASYSAHSAKNKDAHRSLSIAELIVVFTDWPVRSGIDIF